MLKDNKVLQNITFTHHCYHLQRQSNFLNYNMQATTYKKPFNFFKYISLRLHANQASSFLCNKMHASIFTGRVKNLEFFPKEIND